MGGWKLGKDWQKTGKNWQKTGKKPATLRKPAKDRQKNNFFQKFSKLSANFVYSIDP